MTVRDLIGAVVEAGCTVSIAAGKLRVALASALKPELRAALGERRAEIAAELRRVQAERADAILASRRRISATVDPLAVASSDATRLAADRWRRTAAAYGVGQATRAELVDGEKAVISAWCAAAGLAGPCRGCGRTGTGVYLVDHEGRATCGTCFGAGPP